MKRAKKPQSVKVIWNKHEWIVYRSEYTCPVCRVGFHNTLEDNVTRFVCKCGQELIVKP